MQTLRWALARLDPFVIQWPAKWMLDGEIRPVIEYLNRFLHDLSVVLDNGDVLEGYVRNSFVSVARNIDSWSHTFINNADGYPLTVTYSNEGQEIIKTYNYNVDNYVTSVELSGDTPSGIVLRADFTLDADNYVTAVEFS